MDTLVIDALLKVEKELNRLYTIKADLMNEFKNKYHNGMVAFKNSDGTWTRMTLTDNAEKINEGFFKTVKVERFTLKIENLKNMPKELKAEVVNEN